MIYWRNVPIEYFHASEDTYETRKVVFEAIGKLKADFKLVLYSIEKSKYISGGSSKHVYHHAFDELIEKISNHLYTNNINEVIIVTDSIPEKKLKKDLEKAIKQSCAKRFKEKQITYKLYHFSSKSDINLQIVDYLNWAFYRLKAKKEYYYYKQFISL